MKYYLALCCIIKDEPYLEEFIIYHHLIGVEHFYIYDNESNAPISKRLDSFYYRNLCTIIDFPGKSMQMEAYKHCVDKVKNVTKWLAIIDGDEYIFPKIHNTLPDFLRGFDNYQAVGINWLIFGSSFHSKFQPGFCIDKYRYSALHQERHVKCIVKPTYVTHINNPHFSFIKDPKKCVDPKYNIIEGSFNDHVTTDIIQLNHYTLRSYEDRLHKYNRGNADSPDARVYLCESEPDYHSSYNDIINNDLPNKYLENIKSIHKITGINAKIYKSLNPDLKFNTDDEYYQHAFQYAFKENRPCHVTDKYPHFNRDIYKSNYSDLHHLDDLALELHYVYAGVLENHVCDRLL